MSSAYALQIGSSLGKLRLWKQYKKTNLIINLVNTFWEIKAFKIVGPWREEGKYQRCLENAPIFASVVTRPSPDTEPPLFLL